MKIQNKLFLVLDIIAILMLLYYEAYWIAAIAAAVTILIAAIRYWKTGTFLK
ncbi:MAG: hypothetical protein ABJA71_02595 [Ginsengibacter sp.]